MITKGTKILLISIWLLWASVSTFIYTKEDIKYSDVLSKSGIIIFAECYQARTEGGLSISVNYEELGILDDYISLPINFICDDDFARNLKNAEIQIDYYKNYNLGVKFNGEVIIETNEEIKRVNDKTSVLVFLFSVALVSNFVFYFKNKHKNSYKN